jgi:hypothetical protein
MIKRGGSHSPNNADKQDKNKCRRKQRGTTISPLRRLMRVVNNCTMTHPMAATIITVLKMAMILNDAAWSIVIEISRAKHHPTEH